MKLVVQLFASGALAASCPSSSDQFTDKKIFLDRLDLEEMEEASLILKESPLTGGQEHNLQIPSIELGKDCFNYVYLMDPYLPTKAVATAFLDCTEDCKDPARYATVTINRGCQGDIMYYKVGPLGSGEATVEALNEEGTTVFEARPRDGMELRALRDYIVRDLLATLAPLTSESFGGMVYEKEDGSRGGLDFHGTAPPGLYASERLERMFVTVQVPGTGRIKDLHALPLQWRVNATGSNPSTWTVFDLYYNHQGPFESAEALLGAYNDDEVTKVSLPDDWNQRVNEWITPMRPDLPRREFADKHGPELYEPDGKRFRIEGHTIKWMDWELHVSSLQQRGPSIKNIKFKGERIAWEISAQEVTLVYSARDPVQGNVMYFDATFGQGETANSMPGIDCPNTAVYIDDTWWAGSPRHTPRAFCVFESYTDGALWRRYDGFHSGLREHQLVVRTSLPVGNYDYLYEFRFTLDGEVHTNAGASGNMQSYFHTGDLSTQPAQTQFGNRVWTHTMGALHDHQYGFKVDLDIAGENNFVDREKIVVGTAQEAYGDEKVPNYIEYATQRYIERSSPKTEKEATMAINLQKPELYHISNHDNLNAWGHPRTYQIVHHATIANDLPESHPIMKGGTFRKYHIATTVRKEAEANVNTNTALNELLDTTLTLDDYIGDESVEGVDLVSWVSFGFMHLPRSEDAPVQAKVKAGFVIRPYNYFDSNPVLDMPAQVIDAREGNPKTLQEEAPLRECTPKVCDCPATRRRLLFGGATNANAESDKDCECEL